MATRRTSRRIQDLHANVRPIEVSQDLIDSLMKKAAHALSDFKSRQQGRSWTDEDLKKFSARRISKPWRVELVNAIGDAKTVQVELRLPDAKDPSTGGFYIETDFILNNALSNLRRMQKAKNKTDDDLRLIRAHMKSAEEYEREMRGVAGTAVVIVFPRQVKQGLWSWDSVDGPVSLSKTRRSLEHELLHAQDIYGERTLGPKAPFKRPKPTDEARHAKWQQDKSEWERLVKYSNSLAELRAFLRNLVDEIRPFIQAHVPESGSQHRMAPGELGSLIAGELEKTTYWRDHGRYLSRKSRNLLLKGIVTALEDEGIITIE